MRRSAVITLLALLALVASAHNCIHDSPEIQKLLKEDHHVQHQNYRGFKTQAVGNIRIKVFTEDLDDTTKHCTKAGDVRTNFGGGTVTCTEDDVLTAEKKNILVNFIVPSAIAKLERQLSVESVTGNLAVPSGACSGFKKPTAHASSGVADADFVLYVAAGPTNEGTLAWAGTCSTDQNGRPTIGRANFGPAYIQWSTTDPTIPQGQVATAVHELLHAMGFSGSQFVQSYIKTTTIRGKTATIYTHPEVLAKFREQTGCSTSVGPEIEDEGGAGSAGSHWDRRVLKDELMAASGGELFSVMTLAALKATGHYTVDYTKAEDHPWGKGAGCGYLTNKCNTAAGGLGTLFCDDTSGATACTWDSKAIGSCYVSQYNSPVPSQFQYFSNPNLGGQTFLDMCPVVHPYSNRVCNVARERTSSEKIYGHFFSSISRCLVTVGPLTDSQYVQQGSQQRCLEVRCPTSLNYVQFRIEGSRWIDCPEGGGTVSAPSYTGFKGDVMCPAKDASFCDADITVNIDAPVTVAPSTPAPFVTAPPATLADGATYAPTEKPTITEAPAEEGESSLTGSFTLSGDSWPSLVNDPDLSNALKNALRLDLAAIIGLPSRKIIIIGLTSQGGKLTAKFSLIGESGFTDIEVNSTMSKRVGTSNAFPNTNALYSTVSINVPMMTSSSVDTKDTTVSVCGSGYTNAECNVILTGLVTVILLLFLLLILWCCCCKEGREYIPIPGKEQHSPY